MSTITKQAVQAAADLKAGYTLGHADVAILNELARIALASLEAEGKLSSFVASQEALGGDFEKVLAENIEELYVPSSPVTPAPVMPDEMAISDDMNLYQKSFAQGRNACSAAMLNHSENERDMVERVSQSYKLPEEKGASLQLRNLIRKRHAEWSDSTFGNVGPIGPLKHLSKEALEAAAEPDDLSEWADMQFLLWDAQRRAGISDGEITAAMEEKLKVNMARQWPEPKDGEPRLHIKSAPQQEVKSALEHGMQRYAGAMQKLSEGDD